MDDAPQDEGGPFSGERPLLREDDLAKRWQKSVRTLQRWRRQGHGPAYLRIGGTSLYRLKDVLAFEASMRFGGKPTQ